ncbi:MAG: phosphatidylglycerol lysyltransferase domain-containing protein [Bacteroidales bacterium]|jgi:hypothetical protein|nr:phosphatidylglycerol lysyltransferase domain-containing protein [Bacteroidales bacterium]
MNFKDVTLEDKNVFDRFLPIKEVQNCETSFANIIAYNFKYPSQYAIIDGFLCVRTTNAAKDSYTYFMPVGEGDFRNIIKIFVDDAVANGYNMNMIINDCECFRKHFPDFSASPCCDFFDYVYLREDLAQLSGRKYQAKRNHINQIREEYEVIELSEENSGEFFAAQAVSLEEAKVRNPQYADDYDSEDRVINYLLTNFKALDVLGLGIRIEGKLIAFSLGSPINYNTFDVHIEKANRNNGSFALINREMARRIDETYLYINREEDLGIEGLRKAKLSYHPYKMIEKCFARLNR